MSSLAQRFIDDHEDPIFISPLGFPSHPKNQEKMAFSQFFPLLKIVASQVLIRSVAPSDQENLAKVAPGVAVRWIHKAIVLVPK